MSGVAYRTAGDGGVYEEGDVTAPLTTGPDPSANVMLIPFDTTQLTSPTNASNPKSGDPCHPLAAGAHPPAIVFSIMPMNSGKDFKARVTEVAQPLMATGPTTGNQGGDYAVSYAIQAGALRENPLSGPDGVGVQESIAYTLEARAEVQAVAFALRGREDGAVPEIRGDGAAVSALRAASGGSSRDYLATEMRVRRLTPTECERLQGFPDGYTAILVGKKTKKIAADGPRYKALGNSMAVPVMGWIGRSLEAALHRSLVGEDT